MTAAHLDPSHPAPVPGLILPGGGARGAYQVGVVKAIAKLVPGKRNPLPVMVGTSVGAINAAALASQAMNFKSGARRLARLWSRLHTDDVYRTDVGTIAASGMRWLAALAVGGRGVSNPPSFLDNAPLARLLERELDLTRVRAAIAAGALRALGISAASYAQGAAVTFVEGTSDVPEWQRARRLGVRTTLTVDHLMASLSLPFLFPARRIGAEYFGDGSLRLTSPLSPAIRLGADRLLVIGIRDLKRDQVPAEAPPYPSLGNLAGYMLDLIFMDNLDADIERLERVNHTLALLDPERRKETALRPIRVMTIDPSQDLRSIAGRHASTMPRSIRMLMRGIGAWDSEWRLASYLLFEPPYIQELIALGYADAMARGEAILEFLTAQAPSEERATRSASARPTP